MHVQTPPVAHLSIQKHTWEGALCIDCDCPYGAGYTSVINPFPFHFHLFCHLILHYSTLRPVTQTLDPHPRTVLGFSTLYLAPSRSSVRGPTTLSRLLLQGGFLGFGLEP